MPQKTRAEIIADNNEKVRQNSQQPGWDGYAANDYFINKLPLPYTQEDYLHEQRRESPIKLGDSKHAISDLYSECSIKAWEKTNLMDFLTNIRLEDISVPQYIIHPDKYRATYYNEAKIILENINANRYSFQR